MSLPIFQSTDNYQTQQTRWAESLNPVIDLPINKGLVLQSQRLVSGANIIDHKLGRKLQGWFIVRQRAAGTFYDTQDTNSQPQLTLQLTSSTAVTVDIFVF